MYLEIKSAASHTSTTLRERFYLSLILLARSCCVLLVAPSFADETTYHSYVFERCRQQRTIKPKDWQWHARVWERYPLSPSSWTELLVKKHFSASKMWHWRTVKELPRVEVPSDLRSATIYIEVSCMTSNIFWGGGKSYRHQLRERHHIHCCIWHIWLLCAQWWVI